MTLYVFAGLWVGLLGTFFWLWRGRALRYEAALEEIAESNCRYCSSAIAKDALERR